MTAKSQTKTRSSKLANFIKTALKQNSELRYIHFAYLTFLIYQFLKQLLRTVYLNVSRETILF